MRIAVFGRGRNLLAAAELLLDRGHEIAIVWMARVEAYYDVGEKEFRALSDRADARFLSGGSANAPENIDVVRSTNCDMAISINWPGILESDFIDLFPRGILNAHAGDLPRYRGNACPTWAILNGETRVGLCIHLMSERLDAGPILARDYYPLCRDTYVGQIYEWLADRIPGLMADAAEGLAEGRISPELQSESPEDGLRCYPRRASDGRIDWRQPVKQVYALIRASSRPFDGAFTTLEGDRKVVVWRATPVAHRGPFLAVPGHVCCRDDGRAVVACGDGMLRLDEVGLEGFDDPNEAMAAIHKSLRSRLE